MTVISTADKRRICVEAEKLLAEPGATQRNVAGKLGIGQSTLSEWLGDEKLRDGGETEQAAGVEFSSGREQANATSSPTAGRVPTPNEVLREHDLDPADWEVTSIRVSRWGNPDTPMFQLRVNAVRRDSLLQVPDPATWEPLDLSGVEEFSHGSIVFLGDQHAPYHNRALHRATCNFLQGEQPSLIVCLGDLGDWSQISRHRTHPRFAAEVNETTDAAARILYDYRTAAPDAQIIFIPGNHDARLLYALQDYKPELYAARPGRLPTETIEPDEALGFRNLYRLDDLGIDLIDEDWKLAQFSITPELSARHGYLTGNNSERKLLETHGRSQVHGHDHRGSVIYRTKHDPLDIRVAMSCGTMAEVKPDGLGYQPDPDWTPGIGIGHTWDDGMFVLSFAPFVLDKLLLPDGRRFDSEEA